MKSILYLIEKWESCRSTPLYELKCDSCVLNTKIKHPIDLTTEIEGCLEGRACDWIDVLAHEVDLARIQYDFEHRKEL